MVDKTDDNLNGFPETSACTMFTMYFLAYPIISFNIVMTDSPSFSKSDHSLFAGV